jgi:hypothetical protein
MIESSACRGRLSRRNSFSVGRSIGPTRYREGLAAGDRSNKPHVIAVPTYLLHKVIAEEHFKHNHFDKAFGWTVTAPILEPKSPVIDRPELLLKPEERRRPPTFVTAHHLRMISHPVPVSALSLRRINGYTVVVN